MDPESGGGGGQGNHRLALGEGEESGFCPRAISLSLSWILPRPQQVGPLGVESMGPHGAQKMGLEDLYDGKVPVSFTGKLGEMTHAPKLYHLITDTP